MTQNPIFKKDEIVWNRSYIFTMLLTVVNGAFAVLVLLNLFSVSQRAMETGEIRYASFLELYYALAGIELLLLLILAPGLTAGSISGERERKTLGLLLTTQLSPGKILLGKLLNALSLILTLGFSTLPIMITSFLYGGIGLRGILRFLFLYLVLTVFSCAAGLFFSCRCRSTATATISSYALVFVTAVLSVLLYYHREHQPMSEGWLLLLWGILLLLGSLGLLWLSCRYLKRWR